MPDAPVAPADDRFRVDPRLHVRQILTLIPGAQDILLQYGLSCAACSYGSRETLEEGCRAHGFSSADLSDLLQDLQDALIRTPKRPEDLVVTPAAATHARSLVSCAYPYLRVLVDEEGVICLELSQSAQPGEVVLERSGVHLCVSPLLLRSIGGATIDAQEGGLRLHLS